VYETIAKPTFASPPDEPKRRCLRRFDGSMNDYRAYAEIVAASRPRHPRAVSELLADDWRRRLDDYWERWIVERNGQPVAVGTVVEPSWSPRPDKYHLFLLVHPSHRQRGVGRTLFERLRASVESRGATTLTAETSEDEPEAVRFLERRGFRLVLRAPMSRLDLACVDPLDLDLHAATSRADIRIDSVDQLSRLDPRWFDELWRLASDTLKDMPSDEPLAPQSRDDFERRFLLPNVDPGAIFVARSRDGEWLGVSGLTTRPADPTTLGTWFTGVRRAHRRRGVATALKISTVKWALDYGARTIETENEENNPMLGINLRFGFRVAPAWLDYKWERGSAVRSQSSTGSR